MLTGKKANNGYTVSFSHRRVKTLQQANLQYKRVFWEREERWIRLRISTNALKTLEKARAPSTAASPPPRRVRPLDLSANAAPAARVASLRRCRWAWRRWPRRRVSTCTACGMRTPP
jgi:large subunit ribosomal protein L28